MDAQSHDFLLIQAQALLCPTQFVQKLITQYLGFKKLLEAFSVNFQIIFFCRK